jgi:hypothetical protein
MDAVKYALLLGLLLGQTAADVTAPRPVTSKAEAASFATKLGGLAAQARAPKKGAPPVQVTQGEITSYLNLEILPALPGTVTDVDVKLETGRLLATGVVDIDQVKAKLTLSPWNPLSFLSGRMPVNVTGRYAGPKDGYGQVTVEEVRAGRVPIPVSLIEQVVARSTRSAAHPEGIDIRAPFALPKPVKRLRLAPGLAFLDL